MELVLIVSSIFDHSDIAVLEKFQKSNKNSHMYVHVVGKGANAHLETKHMGAFGRFFMKIGWHDASILV